MRDAFYGVRRFSDFHSHLGIPKAVLADRLAFLVEQRVLTKEAGEYQLTGKGKQLWPLIWSMISWGNENYVDKSSRGPTATRGATASSGKIASVSGASRSPTSPISSPTRHAVRAIPVATIRSAARCDGHIGCWIRSAVDSIGAYCDPCHRPIARDRGDQSCQPPLLN